MDKIQTELYNLVAGVTGAEEIGFIDFSQPSLYGKALGASCLATMRSFKLW